MLSDASFCQKQSALLRQESHPPAHPDPIPGASQVQSRSPGRSPGHGLSWGSACPGFCSREDPSILVTTGVLLTPLPMPSTVQEIGWDLCHPTVTELQAQSPGWSLLLHPGSGSLLGQVMPLPGKGHQPPSLRSPAEQSNPFGLVLIPSHPACPFIFLNDFVGGCGSRLP